MTTSFALLVNQLLYARDFPAAQRMAQAGDRFGKWFNGIARTNAKVNFVSRALGYIALGRFFSSGGGDPDHPQIPFDVIIEVDLEDPSTWREPSQLMLDFGFNFWYREKATGALLGKIEGSFLKTLLEATILPKEAF